MLAPGTAPRETVEGGRPRAVDRRPARGGGRSARDGAGARREHRRGQEVLV